MDERVLLRCLFTLAQGMDTFEQFLAEHADDKIVTVTPGGNHGDTLIHMGMIKKLEELGCHYQCLNLEEIYKRRIQVGAKYLLNIAAWCLDIDRGFSLFKIPRDADLILFDGGGYMNDVWYGSVLLRQVMRCHKQPIAIAPQSYLFRKTDFMDFFEKGREATLFCREQYSLEHLSSTSVPENVRIFLSGDTALYLEKEDLNECIESSSETFDLVCFRQDKESIISQQSKREIIEGTENPIVEDISKMGELGDFISIVSNARRIYTDRLHVAILGHILNKETTLYNNRYHKNKGVYEYSLMKNSKVRYEEL